MSLIKLECPVQHYDWGKRGGKSLVAALAGIAGVDEPAAEFWMGAHPKAPALALVDGKKIPLHELVARDPERLLGKAAAQNFGSELPFLFKVLSIGGPLSIQAHPEKTLAAKLHARNPKQYPDENHKPEIAIAVTPLHALAGFKPLAAIKDSTHRIPAWRDFLPAHAIKTLHSDIHDETSPKSSHLRKEIAASIVHADKNHVRAAVQAMQKHLETLDSKSEEDVWFLRAAKLFDAADSGLLWFYLLNLLVVNPGDALFLGPNIPHAYLDGDVVECMASSDNVVRAGLTHKFIDKETLLEMLDYSSSIEHVIRPEIKTGRAIYSTQAKEFTVTRFNSGRPFALDTQNASIALVLAGSGKAVEGSSVLELHARDVYFIPSGSKLTVMPSDNADIYVASVPTQTAS